MTRVIILSIKDSMRRKIISERLISMGVNDYIFYDAFDARDINHNVLSKYFNIDGFFKRYGRLPASGEIGCTLSHLGMWEKISQSSYDNWIVLEDDAILKPKFKSLFYPNNTPNSLTILGRSKYSNFSAYFNYIKHPLRDKIKLESYSYGKIPNLSFRGTVGYFIKKNNALVLYNGLNFKPDFLADDFNVWQQFCDVKTIRPFLVFEDYKNLYSTIEKGRSLKIRRSVNEKKY